MNWIVTPHWDVRTEVSNIAAGVERISESTVNLKWILDKVLLIKGTIFFGGLENQILLTRIQEGI